MIARLVGAYFICEGTAGRQRGVDVTRIVTAAVLWWVTVAQLLARGLFRRYIR